MYGIQNPKSDPTASSKPRWPPLILPDTPLKENSTEPLLATKPFARNTTSPPAGIIKQISPKHPFPISKSMPLFLKPKKPSYIISFRPSIALSTTMNNSAQIYLSMKLNAPCTSITFRKNYPQRREFNATQLRLHNASEKTEHKLSQLGFQICF